MDDQPYSATCVLRGGGARGPPPHGRLTACRGLSPFGPILGLEAAWWALMWNLSINNSILTFIPFDAQFFHDS